MELRSRSRSTTPLRAVEAHQQQQQQVVHNSHMQMTTTTSSTTTVNSSSRVLRSTKLRSVTEASEEALNLKNSNHKAGKQQYTVITSDYSSEDGEHDLTNTENNANHALESKQELHKQQRNDEFIALKMYRDAKEYWNLYPKTDYTYSPHSKDRVELAPGVVNMPNMSRKSIHGSGEYLDYAHKEAGSGVDERHTLQPRALFASSTSSNNNDVYSSSSMHKEVRYAHASTSTREISVVRRVFYAIFYVLYMASRPLAALNAAVVRAVSVAHWCACNVMMLDTWLLRGTASRGARHEDAAATRQRSKLFNVLALCLLPLVFLAGIWLLSALGNAIALVITTATTKSPSQVPPVTIVSDTSTSNLHAAETLIKIQLDSPFRTGLSGVQLKQIAQSLKDNLNLDPDVETIMKVLLVDPKVQLLDESNPADVAAALTKEQIASIANNLNYLQHENVDTLVEKVLESPSIQNLIAAYNTNDQADRISNQDKLIGDLRAQIEALRTDLNAALTSNSANYVQLSHSIKRCCRLNSLQMERYLNSLIASILNSKEHKDNMAQWLGALFVAQNELESKLENVTKKMTNRFDDLTKESAQRVMEDISTKLSGLVSMSSQLDAAVPPDEVKVRALVKQALETYDADKTGLVDYAMESAGGQVLSTRCTEQYSARTSVVSIFGVPLWYPASSPRTVITPGVVPGECWAFQSFPGFLIIKLSYNVTVEAFSYEHVSRQLTPSGRVDSAPRQFQVFGLEHEFDKEPVLLGEYQYDAHGDALQFFPVGADVLRRSFQIVELKVNSNHGNPNYTCLYRFRVHGKIA